MRGPYETKEGPRSYAMSCTVALPDTRLNENVASQASATELFKQLLLEGDYNHANGRTGFTASLRFDRGTNDYIIIDIPSSNTGAGDPKAGTGKGVNAQGIFINSANHGVGGDNPFQVDLDMMFRSMNIHIRDNEPLYP